MPAEQGHDNLEARLEIATEHLANNAASRVFQELRAPASYGLGAEETPENKDVAYFTAREQRPGMPKIRVELPWEDMAMVEAPDAVSQIEADPARLTAILERAGTKLKERAPELWPRFKGQFEVVLATKTGERKVDLP